MALQSIASWASRRNLLAALLCALLIGGVVTVAAGGPSPGKSDDDPTDAVFRSAHAGSCLAWQPEPPQRPAFVQCSSPHLFEVVNALSGDAGDGDIETCAVSGRRYLGQHYDPNGRFAYGLLRSVSSDSSGSGSRVALCGLQLPGVNGQQLPFRGQVAELDQSRVWPPGTCLGVDAKGGQSGLVPVDCAEPHSVEAVGPIDLGAHFHGGPPSDAEQDAVLHPACAALTTAYLEPKTLLSSDLAMNYRPIGPASWSAGSHEVQCALAPRTPGPMTGSLKSPSAAPATAAAVAPHPVAPPPPAPPAPPVTTATTVAPTTVAPTSTAAPTVAPSTPASTASSSASAPAPASSSSPPSSSQTVDAPSSSATDSPAPPAPASPADGPHNPQASPTDTPPPVDGPTHVLQVPGLPDITLPWAPPPL
ncbi:hypothetical protein BOO86_02705 [Mycobacterium sp. CBMA 234]|uniref:septum formation family protein n=1 Tax=Mycolicibacterium sp. CBMA 234 TaxID=1918495 RepID=UPI0012DE390F|nr:septum formation family protein [Mycolicibacterium sp. CBMA 234]MUL63364.1 hypothetical protein [Mycolicibacterium sp. CBMA 234]